MNVDVLLVLDKVLTKQLQIYHILVRSLGRFSDEASFSNQIYFAQRQTQSDGYFSCNCTLSLRGAIKSKKYKRYYFLSPYLSITLAQYFSFLFPVPFSDSFLAFWSFCFQGY